MRRSQEEIKRLKKVSIKLTKTVYIKKKKNKKHRTMEDCYLRYALSGIKDKNEVNLVPSKIGLRNNFDDDHCVIIFRAEHKYYSLNINKCLKHLKHTI